MMIRSIRLTLLCMAIFGVLGCSAGGDAPADAPADAPTATAPDAAQENFSPRAAKTLPLPVPPGQEGRRSGRGSRLQWTVPVGWTTVQPSSSMRLAQYTAPGSAGEGECVVFYFGPGRGGDPASNAIRWAEQFIQPDGGSSVDVMQITELENAAVPVRVVEVTGTYNGGMTMTDAPAKSMKNHMLLGGIAIGADAPWFFKFTGPEATLREQRQAFLDMMASVRPGE